MSLPLQNLNMRAKTLVSTRGEFSSLRAKRVKGGKTKCDEIEAVRLASAGNRRAEAASLVPLRGGRHTYKVNTLMGVIAPEVEEDFR